MTVFLSTVFNVFRKSFRDVFLDDLTRLFKCFMAVFLSNVFNVYRKSFQIVHNTSVVDVLETMPKHELDLGKKKE